MKYIKTYENTKEYNIGDYITFPYNVGKNSLTAFKPYKIDGFFDDEYCIIDNFGESFYIKKTDKDIIHINKKDVELFIKANKYNL